MAILGYSEIILAIICFLFIRHMRNNKTIICNWPVVGMLPSLIAHSKVIHEDTTRLLKLSGGTFHFIGLWFANMDILGTADPTNVHYIMSGNFSNFPKGPELKKVLDFLGQGILNADGHSWNMQRKMYHALINNQRFYQFVMMTSLEKIGKGLIPVLDHVAEEGTMVDKQDVFQRLTFDSTCILVSGFDPGCLSIDLPDVPFAKALDDSEEGVYVRTVVPAWFWKTQKWLGVGQEKKMKKAREILNDFVDNLVSKKRKELKEQVGSKGLDILTTLMSEDYGALEIERDDKFLRDTVLNLMVAGRDTTSACSTWFLWLVSTHPIVEKKILEEIKASMPENNEDGFLKGKENFKKMVYLNGAFCEALRLYPPGPFQQKFPINGGVLPSGHKVDPKIKIMISMYAMGRMESIWGKDCLEFKPERWISKSGTVVHQPSHKFMAFNAGPRTCLGKEMAFTQMKAVAVAIMQKYKVEVVEGQNVTPTLSVILYMKHGLMVKITKR